MFNITAMVFVEVIEPNKAPDPKYISIGESDSNLSDEYLKSKAVSVFKDSNNYPEGTQFKVTGIQRLTLKEYLKYLEGQLKDWANSEEND